MTPLEIGIMLHYYCRADDYNDGDFSAPAVTEALDLFVEKELLKHNTIEVAFEITEGGRMYVESLMKVPIPKKVWVTTPDTFEGYEENPEKPVREIEVYVYRDDDNAEKFSVSDLVLISTNRTLIAQKTITFIPEEGFNVNYSH